MDELPHDTGASYLHRRGWTGRGTTVLLLDTGVVDDPYFSRRHYRILGHRTTTWGHGSGMASAVLAMAPDAVLVSHDLQRTSAVLGLEAATGVMCAWTHAGQDLPLRDRLRRHRDKLLCNVNGPGTLPHDLEPMGQVPGSCDWLARRYGVPGHNATWCGASLALAACVGMALCLVQSGLTLRSAFNHAVAVLRDGEPLPRLLGTDVPEEFR